MGIKKGIDMKLKVKPGYLQLIHQSAYEGPCRLGKGEQLTPEFDEKVGAEKFNFFKKMLNGKYADYVEFLEPEYMTWTDEFILREEELEKLTKDRCNIDLMLFDGVFHQFPATEIATKFKQPVGILGCCNSSDGTAALRNMGLEAYGFIDHIDANRFFKYLRAKVAVNNTRVLQILKNDVISKGVVSGIGNVQELTKNLGIQFTYLNAEDLFHEVRNITPEQKKTAEKIADELIGNAQKNSMTRENVIKSVEFYVVIRSLLEKYECNAFTMPCFEVCATRIFNDEFQFTPCLSHSLLKEEGIPSACEADLNVLMALNVLINLTGKAPHMGNTHPLAQEDKRDESIPTGLELTPEIEGEKNLVSTWHAVQTRKMKGIHESDVTYSLQFFTNAGWGATIRHDFNEDKGETITLLRFNPSGKKMFAVKGEIIAGAGHETIGCATGLYYKVADVKDFFRKQLNFGHHMAWVYGDYIEDLKELGAVLGVEVVTA